MINPKVTAGGIAGAVSILIVAVLAAFGIVLDPSVASAITTLLGFVAGYFKSDNREGAPSGV